MLSLATLHIVPERVSRHDDARVKDEAMISRNTIQPADFDPSNSFTCSHLLVPRSVTGLPNYDAVTAKA